MSSDTDLVDYILESRSNLEIALEVSSAQKAVYERLVKRLFEELNNKVISKPSDWNVERRFFDKVGAPGAGMLLTSANQEVELGFYSNSPEPPMKGVYFYAQSDRPEILDALVRNRGGSKESVTLWSRELPKPWIDWDSDRVKLELYKGAELTSLLGGELTKIVETVLQTL